MYQWIYLEVSFCHFVLNKEHIHMTQIQLWAGEMAEIAEVTLTTKPSLKPLILFILIFIFATGSHYVALASLNSLYRPD